eukprot:Skav210650  [mRNA]  locus=scaffold2527:57986:59386:+ [translate_table: standard]
MDPDFNVTPLQAVAAEVAGGETVVILAERADFEAPFAFRCSIPPTGHPLRSRGLELIFARAASIAVAIVGTSHLRILCDESTLGFLQKRFFANDSLIANMKEFGEVKIEAAEPAAGDVATCQLPFRSRSSAQSEVHSEPLKDQVYVGIDYGRSDIKAVVVDADDNLLAKYVTRWWRPADGRPEYLDPQVPNETKVTVCGVGLSAAGCVKHGKLCGIPPAMGGIEDTAQAREELPRWQCSM